VAITVTDRGSSDFFSASSSTTVLAGAGTFTPAANSHIILLYSIITNVSVSSFTPAANGSIGSVTGPSGSGGWYTVVDETQYVGGWFAGVAIFACKVGGSPGSGNFQVDHNGTGTVERNYWLTVIEVNGAASENWANIGQNTVAVTTTVTATLGSSPAASSLLVGAGMCDANSVLAECAAPTGWTELDGADSSNGGGSWASGYKNGSGTQGPQWTGGYADAGSYYFAAIAEITEAGAATGQPTHKRMGGVPYAALNKGVW
jgi:hypothetical protein